MTAGVEATTVDSPVPAGAPGGAGSPRWREVVTGSGLVSLLAVVLAREMSRPLKLLIASQPTRGLDVGSIEFVHRRIVAERDVGTPVIIVSTELDEVVALADRIAVMYRGRIVGVVPAGTSRDVLGLMMAGVPLEEATAQAAEHHTLTGSAAAGPAGTTAQEGVL